jgi:TolB-like protein/Flp pilus assembly protein TadD
VALVAGHSNDSSGATTEGTVAYMSPEQAQGLEVDQRSDIFSLGVLLFQLVTGDVPYGGQPAAAMIYDIINSPMPSLKPIVADSPAGFERVIRRALEKEPDDRYASIDELLADLQLVRDELRATTGIRPVQAPDPTIVVLPFVDMSPDSDQEYFCDGVSEEIIGALTSVKGLKVVSRTSSFGFKGEAYDIREIGEKLDVQTVLEGSVRKIGERFRITVQHINVSDGYHLWSQRFDREMKDVFAVQDEIAEAVVQALRANLEKQSAATPAKRTHNVEAYNTYLLGRYHLNQRTHEALNKAIECFEQTACDDCNFPLAYAGLAEAYVLLGSGGYPGADPAEALPKAEEAAQREIAIDDSCAEAHTALGLVYSRKDWNWAGAEQEFRRAIELNNGYATGHHQYAMFLAQVNRLEEALSEVRKARELDPLSLIISTAVGRILHFNRRYDEAIAQFERTIDLAPTFPGTYFDLSITYSALERHQEAKGALDKLNRLSGGARLRDTSSAAILHARMGETEKAAEKVRQAMDLAGTQKMPLFVQAILELALGNFDEAFRYVEQAYEERDTGLAYIQCEPFFEPLRQNPRYPELIRKMGFPES